MTGSSLNTNLFRKNAINNLNALDEIQSALKIINTGAWMWVLVALFILIAIIIWGIFGSVTLHIQTQGIILSSEKLSESENLIDQNIKDHNEKVASLKDLFNKKKELFARHYLSQPELLKAKEEYIAAEEELSNPNKNTYISIAELSKYNKINSVNSDLDVLVFIDHSQGKKVSPGMTAYILPNTLSAYDYGYISGVVTNVSEYPVSKQLAYSYLGNMNLVDDFFTGGSPFIAKIKLHRNAKTASGLEWTTKSGASFSIQPGTMVSTKIIYKKCSPIKFLSKNHD